MKTFDFELKRTDEGVILKEIKSTTLSAVELENRIYGLQMEIKSVLDKAKRTKREYEGLLVKKAEMEEMLKSIIQEEKESPEDIFDNFDEIR